MATQTLQCVPWTTELDLGFFAALAKVKLENDKLDSPVRKVLGSYELRWQDAPEHSTMMHIHTNALSKDKLSAGKYRGEGMIRNFNTFEEFKDYDRRGHLERAGRIIWEAINDGSIYSCPSLLSSFSAICFANLKKYTFNYHFAYPALHSDPQWKRNPEKPHQLSSISTTALVDVVQTWRYRVDSRQHGFFLAKRSQDHTSSNSGDSEENPEEVWQVDTLAAFEQGFFTGTPAEDQFVAFSDPSTYPEFPGWMLRNLLVLVKQRFKLEKVQILCYRDTHARREHPTSIILHLSTEPSGPDTPVNKLPKVTGWERNENSKINARTVDLSGFMDPKRLADQAVDLNLKLIKWRIAPDIDLERIKNTSCLLLGAGTLGSYVARNLMGWGVKKITFVDNAKVSYSNPVRQPLYDFQDCLEGGVNKAGRAAEALRQIYPGVDAEGIVMSVPMAGHPITDEAAFLADYAQLCRLIKNHDAVFLLMDTRESRWLPTVMAKSLGKIVINAALGFDTYMVMRHGIRQRKERRVSSSSGLPVSQHSESATPGSAPDTRPAPDFTSSSSTTTSDQTILRTQTDELGCYFCSDVVAPKDSLKSATLDQQCTVTRPGVAPIASALAVELLVSILQSPLRGLAHAPDPAGASAQQRNAAKPAAEGQEKGKPHPLGTVPHQIRGFLSEWSTMTIKGQAYDCCSACSPRIVDTYEREGADFVKRAINQPGYVEEVSGLAEVQRRAEEVADDVEWDDEGELEEIGADGELL